MFADLSDAAIAISRQMKDREKTRERRLRNQVYEDDKSPSFSSPPRIIRFVSSKYTSRGGKYNERRDFFRSYRSID